EESQNFPGPHFESYVLNKSRPGKTVHGNCRRTNPSFFFWKEGRRLSPNHLSNRLGRSQIRCWTRHYAFSRTQDSDFIAQPENLIDKMADKKDSHPLRF